MRFNRRIFLQLWHVGRISHSSLLPSLAQPLAPSASSIQANRETFIATQSRATVAAGCPDTGGHPGDAGLTRSEVKTKMCPKLCANHRGRGDQAPSDAKYPCERIRESLITVIHYAKTSGERRTQGHVYIRSFLTHKEYDNRGNWDRRYGKQ
jgi:HigB_toxin, RelE-like toxic component of a toxin-antitoxin system